MFDVFVHTPINDEFEAFGQTYIESLALGIPSVFTLSGIANDFIVDRRNALVIPHQDSESLFEALDLLLKDGKLREKLILQGKSDVCERFNIQRMIKQMDDLYQSL
jgi:glycosyltransferase involved in cell wall biosynthesis